MMEEQKEAVRARDVERRRAARPARTVAQKMQDGAQRAEKRRHDPRSEAMADTQRQHARDAQCARKARSRRSISAEQIDIVRDQHKRNVQATRESLEEAQREAVRLCGRRASARIRRAAQTRRKRSARLCAMCGAGVSECQAGEAREGIKRSAF